MNKVLSTLKNTGLLALGVSLLLGAKDYKSQIKDSINYEEIYNECISEYVSSDEFIGNLEQGYDAIIADLKSGKIGVEEFYNKANSIITSEKDIHFAISKEDSELGEKYREAMQAENEDMRNKIFSTLGIVGGVFLSLGGGAMLFDNVLDGVDSVKRRIKDKKSKSKKDIEKTDDKDIDMALNKYNNDSTNPTTMDSRHLAFINEEEEKQIQEYLENGFDDDSWNLGN